MASKRKNPIPIGGAVVANPIETGAMSPQPQVEIRLEKGLRATKDPRNPYLVKITQVKYPPERKKTSPVRAVPAPAPAPMARAARAMKPAARAAKRSARKAPARRRPSAGTRLPARPGFPPFTPPSAQRHTETRHNPLPGFEEFARSRKDLAGDVLKMTGILLGVGIGVPALRQMFLKLARKENVGPEGNVTGFSHVIQTMLALGVAGLAEANVEDKGLRRATQALALATALSRPVNQAISKFRPGSEIALLGDATPPVRPIRLDFDVLPPGTNLIQGLGQEVSDLDTDPVLDEILRQRAAKQAAVTAASAPASPPAILSNPQVTPPGEPLMGEVTPPNTAEPLLASPTLSGPQPPTWEDQMSAYLPLGDLVGDPN